MKKRKSMNLVNIIYIIIIAGLLLYGMAESNYNNETKPDIVYEFTNKNINWD